MDCAQNAPSTPHGRPSSINQSPFETFCMSALSPLQPAKRRESPFSKSCSSRVLWPEEKPSSVKKRVIRKLDFVDMSQAYMFQAYTVPVQVNICTDESFATEIPKSRPRKKVTFNASKKPSCNCQRSKCLKLYCECFAANNYCRNCNCKCCRNRPENELERQNAMNAVLEKTSFPNKVDGNSFGCNCKRSGCIKRYCECFQNNKRCSDLCKCRGCKNSF